MAVLHNNAKKNKNKIMTKQETINGRPGCWGRVLNTIGLAPGLKTGRSSVSVVEEFDLQPEIEKTEGEGQSSDVVIPGHALGQSPGSNGSGREGKSWSPTRPEDLDE